MQGILQHQIAIVTGGGQGIGKGIATVLAKAGATVVIAEKKAETGQETVATITEAAAPQSFCQRIRRLRQASRIWLSKQLRCTAVSTPWSITRASPSIGHCWKRPATTGMPFSISTCAAISCAASMCYQR